MKTLLTCYLLFAAFIFAQAQETEMRNQEVSPKNGITDLALVYYSIDFSKEQRKMLNDRELELIFKIDQEGTPELYKINGIQDKSIQDSLKFKSQQIGKFTPRINNGIPEPSIFFLELTYPSRKRISVSSIPYQKAIFSQVRLEDFEYIEKENFGSDIVLGLLANQYIGTPAEYSRLGAGMKINMTFTDHKKYIYGLNLSTYFNKKQKDYPLYTDREQLQSRSTALLGIIFGKWFDKFNIQAEINYAVQNITERYNSHDKGWTQLKGWSPGAVLNYPVMLGRERPLYYYGLPSVFSQNLNVSFGVHYVQFSQKEASGFMAELGLAYRMTFRGIKEYRLIN